MRAAAAVLAAACFAVPAVALAQGAPTPSAPPSGQPPAGQPPAGQPGDPGQPPPAQPDPWGGMNAGGLTPPPPLQEPRPEGEPPPAQPGDVGADLDRSKEADAKRGVSWFWIEAQGGYEHAGLGTFSVDGADVGAGLMETTGNGGAVSAGLGGQILFVTLGARGRLGLFDDWYMARVGGEVGFRIPIGIIEPRFDVGAGYAALTGFDDVVPDEVGLSGFYVRAGAGVDFYPVEILAIGFVTTFDFVGLSRAALTPQEVAGIRANRADITDAQATALASDSTGYGATFALQANVGLHF